jgi:hypothetical protein
MLRSRRVWRIPTNVRYLGYVSVILLKFCETRFAMRE